MSTPSSAPSKSSQTQNLTSPSDSELAKVATWKSCQSEPEFYEVAEEVVRMSNEGGTGVDQIIPSHQHTPHDLRENKEGERAKIAESLIQEQKSHRFETK